jgi:thiamine pyrophosphokinase
MSLFVILLGGDVVWTERLARQIAGARIIAADSGIYHADTLGLVPELWIGDFDSASGAAIERFGDIPREIFPHEKDKTDGELAIDAALARGATSLVLAGAFGGSRADHAFLHLTLALRLAEGGMPVLLTSGNQEGWAVLRGQGRYDLPRGTLFSLLGFSDLSGLSITDAKWPLSDVDVPFGSSLTISNEVEGDLAVSLREGRALMLAHMPGGA